MRGVGKYQIDKAEESRRSVLRALVDGELRYREIVQKTGLGTTTVSKFLKIMEGNGEVEKRVDLESGEYPYPVMYRLSERGVGALEEVEAEQEVHIQGAGKRSGEYYAEEFMRLLLHLDLSRGVVTPKKTLATFGLYPLVALVEAMVPGGEAKLYNGFLSKVYVGAVDERVKRIDDELLAEGRTPTVVKTLWRLASPEAWRSPEEPLPGYNFNFPRIYNKALKAFEKEKLDGVLAKAYPYVDDEKELRRAVFARLKVISHPVRERRQVISKIWEHQKTTSQIV